LALEKERERGSCLLTAYLADYDEVRLASNNTEPTAHFMSDSSTQHKTHRKGTFRLGFPSQPVGSTNHEDQSYSKVCSTVITI